MVDDTQTAQAIDTAHEPGPDGDGTSDGHDDHDHDALGPVDTARWGAFMVGVGAGLVVVLCLVLTLSVIGGGA
jgi:hypothetical protein